MMTTESQKSEIAQAFLKGLRTNDHALLRSIIEPDTVWSMPGESSISGEAAGIDAILQRAAIITAQGMRFSIKRILVGLDGVALSLHNTAEQDGKVFDMHLATVLSLHNERIVGIATYMGSVEKLNEFFKPPK